MSYSTQICSGQSAALAAGSGDSCECELCHEPFLSGGMFSTPLGYLCEACHTDIENAAQDRRNERNALFVEIVRAGARLST